VKCDKCGFDNAENLKYCGNCGNQLVRPEQLIIPGIEKKPKDIKEMQKDPFAKNYKKIFNICFYTVTGLVIFLIFIATFRDWAAVIGTIMDIFLNIWIYPFLIFIFLFRKNHKRWMLVLSIIFGVCTILGASAPYIRPFLSY